MTARSLPRRRAQTDPLSAALRIGLAAILVALIGWLIVTTNLAAAALLVGRPGLAHDLDPGSADAAATESFRLLSEKQPAAAVAMARQALIASPLSAFGMRALATAASERDPQVGARIYGQANALGWRDPVVQLWTARAAFAAGDYDQAAQHADAAARMGTLNVRTPDDPQYLETLELFDALAATPGGIAPLGRQLAEAPNWRLAYLANPLPVDPERLARRATLLGPLARSGHPADELESSLAINRAVAAGEPLVGYAAWRQVATPPAGTGVYDRHFEHVIDDPQRTPVFAWRVSPVAGISAASASDGPGAKPSLDVKTDGTTAGRIATQMLVLTPGLHRVVAHANFATPMAASAFRWSLYCFPDAQDQTLLQPESGDPNGAADFTVRVPKDEVCPAQILALSAQPADTPGSVEAWFDDVSVR